jgi:hypothetical protein
LQPTKILHLRHLDVKNANRKEQNGLRQGVHPVGEVLQQVASTIKAQNTDMKNTLATEKVFEDGFDPLEGGFRVAPPYSIFDQWTEVMPTDQAVEVKVK